MTDHEYEVVKERIIAAMRDWMSALGIGWWNVLMDYDRRGLGTEDVAVTSDYQSATLALTWNAPEIASKTDGELSLIILRVLVTSAFLDEVRASGRATPRVATMLAKTFLQVRGQQVKPAGAQGIRNTAGRTTRYLGVVEDPSVRRAGDK